MPSCPSVLMNTALHLDSSGAVMLPLIEEAFPLQSFFKDTDC